MSSHRLTRFGGLAAVVGLVICVAPASAATHAVKGTVVHRNAHSHSFVVASASGHLTKVYSHHSPAVGRTVRVTVQRAPQGRLKATRLRVGSKQRRVRLRGTITYAGKGKFTLSAGGASILVKAHRARRHDASDSSDDSQDSPDSTDSTSTDAPATGNEVIVISKIDLSGDLEAENIDDLGSDQGTIEIEGVIKSIDPATRIVTVSADDEDRSGATITVQMFEGFDFTQIAVGESVDAKLMRLPDGTYSVIEADLENADNNADDDQGD